MEETREVLELPSSYAVIELPDDTVEAKISATILRNGGLETVERTLATKEVWKAFKEAEDGYIPSDAVFEITDEGRRWLEERQRNSSATSILSS